MDTTATIVYNGQSTVLPSGVFDDLCNYDYSNVSSGSFWLLPPTDPGLVAIVLPYVQAISGLQNCTGLQVLLSGSSPLKVNLAGMDAKLNSTREMAYRLTNRDGRTFEGYATGSLNEDEGWLMVNRDGRGFIVDGFLNGDDWFGDHDKRYASGFEDLAVTFSDFIETDDAGGKYIPLFRLSDQVKKDLLYKREKGEDITPNPSFDLQVLDAQNNIHAAADYFDRIYLTYDVVSQIDKQNKNFIAQRGRVRLLGSNDEYRTIVDQWNITDMPTFSLSRKAMPASRSHILPAPKAGQQ